MGYQERRNAVDEYIELLRSARLSAEFKALARSCQLEGVIAAKDSCEGKKGNVSFSALSLMYALGMALEGASPDLRDKALHALCGGGVNWELLAKDYKSILELAVRNPNASCSVANLAAINECQSATTEGRRYEKEIEDVFGGVVSYMDFSSEASSNELSDWVSKKTKGKLKPKIELDPSMVFALVNTLYLKSCWCSEFDKSDTKPGMFHGPEEEFEAQFMSGTVCGTSVYFGDSYERIELPLEGDFVCKLVKPGHGQTVDELLRKPGQLESALCGGSKRKCDVNLKLPRFEARTSLDVMPILSRLGFDFLLAKDGRGMRRLFREPSYVGSAKQETYMKVNEEGLEGAACTIMYAVAGCAMFDKNEEIDIAFDRPFLFSVEDRNGIPFFTGIVNEPERA